ncbi:type II secretion system F family protein [Victivallis sp. Marseille-Q1083]|uniref:type II secretion system F family protein n=1 Tax=Victivallis sp. Marseille-Q1083 TaxID=2717288 RepID=UPI0015897D00|nr:type II secretion system F family protein [Victivallis sp. Marseille-Q1083]
MQQFRYLVLKGDGGETEMRVEAGSEAEARRKLRRLGARPVRQLALEEEGDGGAIWKMRRCRFNVYAFTNRLAPLLAANIPLEKAFAVLEEGALNEADLKVIRQLRKGLHEGRSFSALVREMPRHFPPLYGSLLESGEESGCLPEVVRELRRFLKDSKEFRDFIITSSIYPVIVVSVTFLVVILLFTVFIPRFAKIFEDLGKEMPLLTKMMLEIGNAIQAVWWLWPLLVIGLIYWFRASRRNGRLKGVHDRVALKLPLIGPILRSVEIGRFVRTLSIMTRNHVHILTAVRIAGRVIGNGEIAGSFTAVEQELRGGSRLSGALAVSSFMDRSSLAMLKIAEESGELGDMLQRVAEEREDETRVKVKRLLALLEPMVILFLAFIVLLVVLAIFLAIMEMNVIK